MQPYLPVALAIASGVTEFIGQRTAAKSQEAQNAEARNNAIEARDQDLQTIEARRTQEREAAAQKLQESQRQVAAEQSDKIAASSASGNSGLSVNALLMDYMRQHLENEQSIQTNLSNVNDQLDRERAKVVSDAKSRVNSLPSVTEPSFLGAAFKIGGDAYSTYLATKPPSKPPVLPKRPA